MMSEGLQAEIETLIGKPSAPVTMRIDPAEVGLFAEAVGDPAPDDGVVPITYFAAIPYERPALPGDADRHLINVENTFTFERALRAGEEITTRAAFTHVARRGPLVTARLACRYLDADGALVAVGTVSWIIDREGICAEGADDRECERCSRTQAIADPVATTKAFDLLDPRTLRAGSVLPALRKAPLTTAQFARYGRASGDLTPVHLDRAVALRAGFPDVIAPGLLKMAFFGQHMMMFGKRARVRRLEAKYLGFDLPGAELTSHAEIADVSAGEDGRRTLTVDLSLRDGEDEPRTSGRASIELTSSGE